MHFLQGPVQKTFLLTWLQRKQNTVLHYYNAALWKHIFETPVFHVHHVVINNKVNSKISLELEKIWNVMNDVAVSTMYKHEAFNIPDKSERNDIPRVKGHGTLESKKTLQCQKTKSVSFKYLMQVNFVLNKLFQNNGIYRRRSKNSEEYRIFEFLFRFNRVWINSRLLLLLSSKRVIFNHEKGLLSPSSPKGLSLAPSQLFDIARQAYLIITMLVQLFMVYSMLGLFVPFHMQF